MNNCKIANELRKYRDLTGCVNRAGLSDDPENYVEYVITRELSYMDMVTANAVYSLWRSGEGDNGFRAETIGQIMAGDMARRLRPEKQDEIEERLQKLAGTELYILADHDQQAMQEVYEGAFLPLTWETGRSRLRFRFKDGGQKFQNRRWYVSSRNRLAKYSKQPPRMTPPAKTAQAPYRRSGNRIKVISSAPSPQTRLTGP